MAFLTEEEINSTYEYWLKNAKDSEILSELKAIENDRAEIADRFYTFLSFGTGGMRGVLGAGINRMNIYTVARAASALCDWVNSSPNRKRKSIAIAYDTRINSRLFAFLCAKIIAKAGIAAFIYDKPQPTPALSFAVRYNSCDAGIVITASHNPAKYNGFKVYGPDGGQLTDSGADKIQQYMLKTDMFGVVSEAMSVSENDPSIIPMGENVIDPFIDEVLKCRAKTEKSANNLSVCYTPLNGTGKECVTKALTRIGVKNIIAVSEQYLPDGNFPTCPYPNPELKEALALGLSVAKKEGADILIATDPDSDRISAAIAHGGTYELLNGNELGMLMLSYILEKRKQNGTLPNDAKVITTIVSSMMTDDIASAYGVRVERTLTGFKYIGEKITSYEEKNAESEFVFGFEESCGYLIGSYVRDKDAVGAAVTVYDMAEEAKNCGSDLYEKMQELYKRFGYQKTLLLSFAFDGEEGMLKMADIMKKLRLSYPRMLTNRAVTAFTDYLSGENGLPEADVLEFCTADGLKMIVRPSGTEPKIKVYLFSVSENEEVSIQLLNSMKEETETLING